MRKVFFDRIYASSGSASLRKSREMHQSAARPTSVYITRLTVAVCPPQIHATISNLNRPMLPQLMPPIMVRISAMRSIITCKHSFPTQYSRSEKNYLQKFFHSTKAVFFRSLQGCAGDVLSKHSLSNRSCKARPRLISLSHNPVYAGRLPACSFYCLAATRSSRRLTISARRSMPHRAKSFCRRYSMSVPAMYIAAAQPSSHGMTSAALRSAINAKLSAM